MKAFIRSFACVFVATVSAVLPTAALAGSKALALKVTGSITAAPAWQDASSSALTQLQFDFSGMAGESANADVLSTSAQAKLVNMTASTTIGLVRPKGCQIGSTSVSDAHVVFVAGASEISSDSATAFSMSNNVLMTFGMKFAAAGGYGAASGAVTCSTDGSLTYSY